MYTDTHNWEFGCWLESSFSRKVTLFGWSNGPVGSGAAEPVFVLKNENRTAFRI